MAQIGRLCLSLGRHTTLRSARPLAYGPQQMTGTISFLGSSSDVMTVSPTSKQTSFSCETRRSVVTGTATAHLSGVHGLPTITTDDGMGFSQGFGELSLTGTESRLASW